MAQKITANIPHNLGQAEARRRIEEGFGQIESQLAAGPAKIVNVQQRWEGDRLLFEGGAMGQQLTGRLSVFEDSVAIEVDLPPFLAAFANMISKRLTTEGQRLLTR